MLEPFDFKYVEDIAVIVFLDDKILVKTEEDEFSLPLFPIQLPVAFNIKFHVFHNAKCAISTPYFVGVIGATAYFTAKVINRDDYFVPDYAFLSIEYVYNSVKISNKSELFYRAYELIK